MQDGAGMISVVVPVFNEEGNVEKLYAGITSALQSQGVSYELVFVDDGSTDRSVKLLTGLREKDPQVRIIALGRNFGRQMALTAGLDHAHGSAVIMMDADLQHPPELLPQLIAAHLAGAEIVYTTRHYTTAVGLGKRLSTALFYKCAAFMGIALPESGTEFMLLDQKVVRYLRQTRERTRFLRGIIFWLGFKRAAVSFTVPKRYSGTTKYSLRTMITAALDCIFSFSAAPLYVAGYLGALVSAAGFVYGVYVLYIKFIKGVAVPGWTSIVLAVLGLGGMQLMSLGIVGAYLGRVYEEIKARPLYTIANSWGIADRDA